MKTVYLKPVRGNSGLMLNGNRYRLTAGQTSIELPEADAATLAANFAYLIDETPAPKTAKKKAAVADADAVKPDETSL